MNGELAALIFVCVIFSWIPILSLCKGISWIVDAFQPEYIDDEDDINKDE